MACCRSARGLPACLPTSVKAASRCRNLRCACSSSTTSAHGDALPTSCPTPPRTHIHHSADDDCHGHDQMLARWGRQQQEGREGEAVLFVMHDACMMSGWALSCLASFHDGGECLPCSLHGAIDVVLQAGQVATPREGGRGGRRDRAGRGRQARGGAASSSRRQGRERQQAAVRGGGQVVGMGRRQRRVRRRRRRGGRRGVRGGGGWLKGGGALGRAGQQRQQLLQRPPALTSAVVLLHRQHRLHQRQARQQEDHQSSGGQRAGW